MSARCPPGTFAAGRDIYPGAEPPEPAIDGAGRRFSSCSEWATSKDPDRTVTGAAGDTHARHGFGRSRLWLELAEVLGFFDEGLPHQFGVLVVLVRATELAQA